MKPNILYEKKEGIAIITLNKPERRNAFDKAMRIELFQNLDRIEKDEDVKVLVLTGAGKAFCAGGDVKSMAERFDQKPVETRENLHQAARLLRKIRESEKPAIAAVNGPAVGAGCNLALICDIRVASEKATFGELFVRRGLHPDFGGTFTLTRLVGTAKACELIFTGRLIDAWEAKEIGLVNQVVSEAEFEQTWMDLAKQIAQGPPIPIRMAKTAIYQAERSDLSSMLEYEAFAQSIAFQTEDFRGAVKAFIEKKEPVFRGR